MNNLTRTMTLLFITSLLIGCGHTESSPNAIAIKPASTSEARVEDTSPDQSNSSEIYGPPVKLGDLEDQAINESSGIAASRRNPDLFWTHNDSGDGPFLYAFDRRGKRQGVWQVKGAKARDWEDMAMGPGPEQGRSYIYIGDIGDNDRERDEIIVYRVAEPAITPDDASSAKASPAQTETAEAIRLKYPDGAHDAEALLVHPLTGDLYIVTKEMDVASGVYKIAAPLPTAEVGKLIRVGEVKAPGLLGSLITGGDIAPDGSHVILCDYTSAYEIALLAGSSDHFDKVWEQPLSTFSIGTRRQGEAVCYRLDGKAALATSEKLPCPLIETPRRNALTR